MTASRETTSRETLVAIDVAKRQNDVLVEQPGGECQAFKVANKLSDFQKFAEYLHSLSQPCRIAFEPTADYHRPLAWFLLKAGFELQLVSSVVACPRFHVHLN